jgi:hypothetical protein
VDFGVDVRRLLGEVGRVAVGDGGSVAARMSRTLVSGAGCGSSATIGVGVADSTSTDVETAMTSGDNVGIPVALGAAVVGAPAPDSGALVMWGMGLGVAVAITIATWVDIAGSNGFSFAATTAEAAMASRSSSFSLVDTLC